jgi:hypothetical protein
MGVSGENSENNIAFDVMQFFAQYPRELRSAFVQKTQ